METHRSFRRAFREPLLVSRVILRITVPKIGDGILQVGLFELLDTFLMPPKAVLTAFLRAHLYI
jgi:hypothetical protein